MNRHYLAVVATLVVIPLLCLAARCGDESASTSCGVLRTSDTLLDDAINNNGIAAIDLSLKPGDYEVRVTKAFTGDNEATYQLLVSDEVGLAIPQRGPSWEATP